MEIQDDSFLLNKINDFVHWFESNQLNSHDPCDFTCNKILNKSENLKHKINNFIPSPIDYYSVYSLENVFPRICRVLIKKKKAAISSALFADGLLNMKDSGWGRKDVDKMVIKELDWLVKNRCNRYKGYSWGLPFDWFMGNDGKGNGVLSKEGTPYSTLSIYPINAFMHARESKILPEKYYDVVTNSKYLFTHYLKKRTMPSTSISVSYSPVDDFYIINANAYSAAALCRINESIPLAKQLVKYVLEEQNKDGSWNYWGSIEKERHTSVDSLHQVYILQCLAMCHDRLGDIEIKNSIEHGIEFFISNFFEDGHILKFPQSYKDIYQEEYELIDISESLSFFIDISSLFPRYLEWVDILFSGLMGDYSLNGKSYFRTKLNPKSGIDIPFIRWGQIQAFNAITKYYKLCQITK